MKQLWLIDAYNIIRSNPTLAAFEQKQGTPATVNHFVDLCRQVQPPDEQWIVFFDGPGQVQAFEEPAMEVLFSGELTADELIIDKARYLLSQGKEVVIASSDFDLYEKGAQKNNAYEFYDRLMTRPAQAAVDQPVPVNPADVLVFLKNAGHLPADYEPPTPLVSELAQVLEYFGESIGKKANKAAAQIQTAVARHAPLSPNPDPEKQIQRALKAYLRGE